MQSIENHFDNFNNLKILVIGDVMIDSYLYGKVDRISPEAPVPIVAVDRRENRMGGAANVAINIAAMGATPILCSVIGNDLKAEEFSEMLVEKNMPTSGIIKSKDRKTTVKFRVIGNNLQMLRVDEEDTTNINDSEFDKLCSFIENCIEKKEVDAIIFEDYDKGVILPELISKVTSLARKYSIPVSVDPKKKNFLKYREVTLFKPNLKELKEGLKLDSLNPKDLSAMDYAIKRLLEELNLEMALVTLSEHGVMICKKDQVSGGFEMQHVPAHIRNISDVSGAGDTVISVATLCLASGMDAYHIAAISNLAGGIVCEEIGAVPINKEKLLKEVIAKL